MIIPQDRVNVAVIIFLYGNYINVSVKRQLKLLLLEWYTHTLILVKTRFRFHKRVFVFLLVYFNLIFSVLVMGPRAVYVLGKHSTINLRPLLPCFQCFFYFISQTNLCLFGMWGHGTYYVAHMLNPKDTCGSWFFSSTMRDLGKKSCCPVANAFVY